MGHTHNPLPLFEPQTCVLIAISYHLNYLINILFLEKSYDKCRYCEGILVWCMNQQKHFDLSQFEPIHLDIYR